MDDRLAGVISSLKVIPKNRWDDYILRQDLFYRHYTEEMCQDIVQKAKEAGRKKALEVSAESRDMEELIRINGLKVKIAQDKEFIMPDSINFAEYHDGEIKISKRLLRALDKNKDTLFRVLGEFQPCSVLFCHELYHFYEDTEENLENAGITIKIKPIPFINKTISPESAGEIAAYEFAGQMQKIDFHPYILGLIGLYEYDRNAADSIMNSISNTV